MPVITEHHVPFNHGHTWVRLTHPDTPVAGAHPLVVLHGGPGFAHDYLRNLAALADSTGRPVVHYDQHGCGRSTHRPDAPPDYWTPELFIREFHAVLDALGIRRAHVLGHSWGGMLGAEIAATQAPQVVSLSLCNTLAALPLWIEAARTLRAALPPEVREVLEHHEAEGSLDHPDYLAAAREYDRRHVVRMPEYPPDYADSVARVEADPTVYHTMNGPNEFHVIGTLKDWSIIDRLSRIAVPTLVVAGEFDEAQPIVWQPFLDHVADVRAVVIPGASHCSHLEYPETFQEIIGAFIGRHDAHPEAA
ncbi:proline iminopeptidase-family hydrolase [Bordetella genomosp. 1]|uniref:Alpha/beta hydrolase n=1 Tax=Bordetella genomosp. 1 TaxID=1395607 RepID=A0ABX4F0W3_9BORD|nr:proline iminopeptidase-family hydrolase [Bordetella genomosp. 1]MDQ8031639.1 proline iminopeptidase-family hydrolase [Bordetella sp.]OZI63989.1 alpha/beta hydrolase [Bordetella genomosp. 1]